MNPRLVYGLCAALLAMPTASEAQKGDLPKGSITPAAANMMASGVTQLDFEEMSPETLLSMPYQKNGITIGAWGSGYFPSVRDLTRSMIVHGPRSMAINSSPLPGSTGGLKITFKSDVLAFWISAIKQGGSTVQLELSDKTGSLKKSATISFDPADPDGTYRTFFMNATFRPKTIVVSNGLWLARVAVAP